MEDHCFIESTNSTNELMRQLLTEKKLPEGYIVHTGFQTTGKGQAGNSWESEHDKNLLFSMVLYPAQIPVEEQFLVSQLVSVALIKVLAKRVSNVTVKWPNDIYIGDKKVAGILIENTWKGNKIGFSVIGIGLNVNQSEFFSDAPNPVSLFQITGTETDRDALLGDIRAQIMNEYLQSQPQKIRKDYLEALYRKRGFFPFRNAEGEFMAEIVDVQPDGQLELQTEDGEKKEFYFKEVSFVI